MKRYYISQGTVYFPLSYDRTILKDLETADSETIMNHNGSRFVKGTDLLDMLRTSADFDEQVEEVLNATTGGLYLKTIPQHLKTLMIVLFRIFPAFSSLREKTMMKHLLNSQVLQRARSLIGDYETVIKLQEIDIVIEKEGFCSDLEYEELSFALKRSLVHNKAVGKLKKKKDQFAALEKQHTKVVKRLAVVLRILDGLNDDALEYEKIGLEKIEGKIFYYLKVEPYKLMDRNRKVYQFPACRVGVNLDNLANTVVIEPYQHPFLSSFKMMQTICFGTAPKKVAINSHSIIANLNNGIQILQMGWPSKNPYYQLGYFSKHEVGKLEDYAKDELASITNLVNYPQLII